MLNIESPFAHAVIGSLVLYLPALGGCALSFWPLEGFLGFTLIMLGAGLSLFAYLVGLGAMFLSRFGARGMEVAQTAPSVSGTPAPATE